PMRGPIPTRRCRTSMCIFLAGGRSAPCWSNAEASAWAARGRDLSDAGSEFPRKLVERHFRPRAIVTDHFRRRTRRETPALGEVLAARQAVEESGGIEVPRAGGVHHLGHR